MSEIKKQVLAGFLLVSLIIFGLWYHATTNQIFGVRQSREQINDSLADANKLAAELKVARADAAKAAKAAADELAAATKAAERDITFVGGLANPLRVASLVLATADYPGSLRDIYYATFTADGFSPSLRERGAAFDAAKSLLFGNRAALAQVLWGSPVVRAVVMARLQEMRDELVFLSRHPELLKGLPVEVIQACGYHGCSYEKNIFEAYALKAPMDTEEVSGAYFFLEFLVRRHREHGPATVEALLGMMREAIAELFPTPAAPLPARATEPPLATP